MPLDTLIAAVHNADVARDVRAIGSEHMAETVSCRQCGSQFAPKSVANIYCSRQCQLDFRAGRAQEESQRRAETGFAWDPVQVARPIKVVVPKPQPWQGNLLKGWKTAVILPDQQIGYRRLLDGRFQPFHDPRALNIAEQIVNAERPDLTVMLGDLNDNAPWGKYRQEAGFVPATQAGIDRASLHVATVAELSDETRILSGNHDIRIENSTLDNALASYGLRQARRQPGEYPVMSMPYLLNLNSMKNVSWIGGYPSGATYVNSNLAAIHGRITGPNVIDKVLASEAVSVVFGHVHRIHDGLLTRNDRSRPRFTRAFSPGCLCRIDGTVPSTKAGLTPWGEPVKSWEAWQQGLAVVRYQEGNGKFSVEMIPIFEGWAFHRGVEFFSTKDIEDPELEHLGV